MPFKCISVCDWGLDLKELRDIWKWEIITQSKVRDKQIHTAFINLKHFVGVGVIFYTI